MPSNSSSSFSYLLISPLQPQQPPSPQPPRRNFLTPFSYNISYFLSHSFLPHIVMVSSISSLSTHLTSLKQDLSTTPFPLKRPSLLHFSSNLLCLCSTPSLTATTTVQKPTPVTTTGGIRCT